MSMGRRAVVVLLLAATAGCSVRTADLSLAAPRWPGPGPFTAFGRTEGRSCRWWVAGVPLGLPTIDEAMQAALAVGHGRLLRDVTIWSDHPFYVFVGRNCYIVRGELWR